MSDAGPRPPSIPVVAEELLLLSRRGNLSVPKQEWVLERSAYLLLTRLEKGEPMTMKEFAATFGLDASTINRQVNALLNQGLAERIPDPDGGPARRLRATPTGHRLVAEQHEIRMRSVEALLHDWSPQDRTALGALLRRLNEAVEERDGLDWPRD